MNKIISFIRSIVKIAEEKFSCLCYAYYDNPFWVICVDDYDLYKSDEFKHWSEKIRSQSQPLKIKIVFCYCNPIEEKLVELSESAHLIMNI